MTRIGRPPKKKALLRNSRWTVYATSRVAREIAAQAEKAGLSVSQYFLALKAENEKLRERIRELEHGG